MKGGRKKMQGTDGRSIVPIASAMVRFPALSRGLFARGDAEGSGDGGGGGGGEDMVVAAAAAEVGGEVMKDEDTAVVVMMVMVVSVICR
jgi:hypothetical protein